MRVAALYDIHGNLPALEAVLAERTTVASWPQAVERDIEGLGKVIFCHATPLDDEAILTRITPEEAVFTELAGIDATVVVCGHTHVQFDRRVPGAPRLVNAGSVGMPYEGVPGAFWALVGPEIELRRTTYDVERALASLRATTFPGLNEVFARSLEGRITASEATTEFESRRGA